MDRAGSNDLQRLFLFLAVATSLAIGSLGYVSGSAPEWIALKSSAGLLVVGIIGWLASTVVSVAPDEKIDEAKGTTVDVTLAETAPADSGADE